MRRSLRAVWWQISKRLWNATWTLRLANGLLFRAHPDCRVSSALVYADWPEHRELMFLRRRLGPGQVVIDVGANVGHISLLLADIVGSDAIVAFEPTPVSFERLRENWRLNGWPGDGLVQAAIGAREGRVYVDDTSHPSTVNQVSVEGGSDKIRVPMEPLDAFRDRWRDREVGLLKIDVEGHEAAVLRGARRVLCEDRPGVIMFESLDGRPAPEVRSLLEDAGYGLFGLDESGAPDPEELSAQNLFAVPAGAGEGAGP